MNIIIEFPCQIQQVGEKAIKIELCKTEDLEMVNPDTIRKVCPDLSTQDALSLAIEADEWLLKQGILRSCTSYIQKG